MTVVNTAFAKPNYQLHRDLTGSPIVADSADLNALKTLTVVGGTIPRRDLFDAGGWRTVRGVVQVTGGTSVDLVPLEMASLRDGAGTVTQQLVAIASAITGLVDQDTFGPIEVNGARILMRVSIVTDAVTNLKIYLVGAEAMNVLPGSRR